MAIIRACLPEGLIWYTKGHLATRNRTAKDKILPLWAAGPARVGRGVASQGKPERKIAETWLQESFGYITVAKPADAGGASRMSRISSPKRKRSCGTTGRMVGSSLDRMEVP